MPCTEPLCEERTSRGAPSLLCLCAPWFPAYLQCLNTVFCHKLMFFAQYGQPRQEHFQTWSHVVSGHRPHLCLEFTSPALIKVVKCINTKKKLNLSGHISLTLLDLFLVSWAARRWIREAPCHSEVRYLKVGPRQWKAGIIDSCQMSHSPELQDPRRAAWMLVLPTSVLKLTVVIADIAVC